VLLALVTGHVVAALWHHYVRSDDILRSMQPLARRTRASAPASRARRIALAIGLSTLIGASLSFSTAARATDNDTGADLYDQECADCHSLARPLRNKKGPSLVGVVGMAAARVPGYNYSEALKQARIAWTKDTLDAFIADPKKVVPGGGKMKYDGLDKADERAAIIDFLSLQQ
jgi:cytochrome c